MNRTDKQTAIDQRSIVWQQNQPAGLRRPRRSADALWKRSSPKTIVALARTPNRPTDAQVKSRRGAGRVEDVDVDSAAHANAGADVKHDKGTARMLERIRAEQAERTAESKRHSTHCTKNAPLLEKALQNMSSSASEPDQYREPVWNDALSRGTRYQGNRSLESSLSRNSAEPYRRSSEVLFAASSDHSFSHQRS
jgi:hypothetical protein